MALRSVKGVLLVIERVSTPRLLAALTWFWTRASSGEMTTVTPLEHHAGSWKQRDLPKEVAAWTKISWPSRAALMISRWRGRKACFWKTFLSG